jgi:hypothetical protein
VTPLILKCAPIGDNEDDYDVLENGVVVGRIFTVPTAPEGCPWMWASGHSADSVKRAAHGYEATREAAMRRSPRAGMRGDGLSEMSFDTPPYTATYTHVARNNARRCKRFTNLQKDSVLARPPMRPCASSCPERLEDAHTATGARAHEVPAAGPVRALYRRYRRPARRPRPV